MPSAALAAVSSVEEDARETRCSKTPEPTPTRSTRTMGTSPVTETKPFHFKSEERHRKALASNQNKGNFAGRRQTPEHEDDPKKLAEVKVRRAREYAQNWAPRNESPSGKGVTVPKSPRFSVEARIQYHHEVLEPKKKMKEAAQEREKRREQRRKEEEEERKLREYRRTLVPRARAMPSFVGPVFQPDYTSAQPITKAKEPRLVTSARFGRQLSPKAPPAYSMRSRSPMNDASMLQQQQYTAAKSQLPPAPYPNSSSSASLPDENQENETGNGDNAGAAADAAIDSQMQARDEGSSGGSSIPTVPREDGGAEDIQTKL